MVKFNYTLFDYIPQTAGCAIPRPIYVPDKGSSNNLNLLGAFIATMLGIEFKYATALAKGDPFDPNSAFTFLYPDIDRTPYLNMNLKSFKCSVRIENLSFFI